MTSKGDPETHEERARAGAAAAPQSAAAPPGGGDGGAADSGAGAAVTIAGAAFCATPWATPQIALALGIVLALLNLAGLKRLARTASRFLIQACVVLLGFRMNVWDVAKAGVSGLALATGTVAAAFALGWVLMRALRVERTTGLLVSTGTAVCGGSAITAVGTAIEATGAQLAVATGIVFILNGAAIYLYPWLGHAMGLSDVQFGVWAGLGIHDVSAVVGAAKQYHADGGAGTAALDTAAVVKMCRVIWIIPVAVGAAWLHRGGAGHSAEGARPAARAPIPWFIALFLVASAVRTAVPAIAPWAPNIQAVAAAGVSVALFLIGTGLSKSAIREVGWRPLAQAAVLWVVVGSAALMVARAGVF